MICGVFWQGVGVFLFAGLWRGFAEGLWRSFASVMGSFGFRWAVLGCFRGCSGSVFEVLWRCSGGVLDVCSEVCFGGVFWRCSGGVLFRVVFWGRFGVRFWWSFVVCFFWGGRGGGGEPLGTACLSSPARGQSSWRRSRPQPSVAPICGKRVELRTLATGNGDPRRRGLRERDVGLRKDEVVQVLLRGPLPSWRELQARLAPPAPEFDTSRGPLGDDGAPPIIGSAPNWECWHEVFGAQLVGLCFG